MSFYRHHVFMCTHSRENGKACCAQKDAQRLRDYAKDRTKALKLTGVGKCRVNNAGCLDRCNLGPILVIYPDDVWYRYENQEDIDEIIEEHIQNGREVVRLKL